MTVQNGETITAGDVAEVPAEVAAEESRMPSVSAGDFAKLFIAQGGVIRTEVFQKTIKEMAASIPMSEGSFRTRFSNFRKDCKEQGVNLPKFKEGRVGNTGKRVSESAGKRALKELLQKVAN